MASESGGDGETKRSRQRPPDSPGERLAIAAMISEGCPNDADESGDDDA